MSTRLLIGKVGLDGHDRGVKIVCRALRDAGFEIIYTGLQQTPQQIAVAAVHEDVAGVGLSILSGAHMTLIPAVLAELRAHGAGEIPVFCGGIIPDADIADLRRAGVVAVFTPGTPTGDIISWARQRYPLPDEVSRV
jgi:methylmalonyl-CoA mutase C-terminal domain/subunit